MLTSILQAIAAIPALLSAISELTKMLKKLFTEQNKDVIKKTGEAFKELNQSKDRKEKANAARKIRDILSRT